MYVNGFILFTNGLLLEEIVRDDKLLAYHFQKRLGVTVNGYAVNLNEFEKVYGKFSDINLHFVIPRSNADAAVDKITKSVEVSGPDRVGYIISPDTTNNLLDDVVLNEYRNVYMNFILFVAPFLMNSGFRIVIDHGLPNCFFTQDMIDMLARRNLSMFARNTACQCDDRCMGLIDCDFDFYFCNQTRINFGSIIDRHGEPMSYPEIFAKATQDHPRK